MSGASFSGTRWGSRAPDVEVVVVGAGPGGSAVAGSLASLGHEVLLLDKARFPRHKACSEYVNPEAVRLLDRLGAGEDVRAKGPHRVERMVVHAPGGGRFVADFSRVHGIDSTRRSCSRPNRVARVSDRACTCGMSSATANAWLGLRRAWTVEGR
jgi:2-polyprenyl-6-methoxyphenol hydroxylase-like FAD-dependent oxidoreductase